MKKTHILKFIALTLLLCNGSILAQSSISIVEKQQQYDNYFNKINENRIGIENSDIDKIVNPFVYNSKVVVLSNASAEKKTYSLNAIFDDRVMINDKWYLLKSKIDGMSVSSIKSNSAILTSPNRKIEIYLRKKNENSFVETN